MINSGMRLLLLLLVVSCSTSQPGLMPIDTNVSCSLSEHEIVELLRTDSENKRWKRVYMNEINIATNNEDWTSVGFFVNEYVDIPHDIVPLWLRYRDEYTAPVSRLEQYFRIDIFLPAE